MASKKSSGPDDGLDYEKFFRAMNVANERPRYEHTVTPIDYPNGIVPLGAPYAKDEVRKVDPNTGGEKGEKLARTDLLPVSAILELSEHYGKGELKYPSDDGPNWRKGYSWSLSYAAAMRHLLQFWGGEDLDAETQSKHVIAAAWHCLALAVFMDDHKDLDNRIPR